MRALIINKEAISALIEYAQANIVTTKQMQETIEGKRKPVGDIPEHIIFLPVGYCIVFSIEAQPTGLVRHISVSLVKKDCYPSFKAAKLIAEAFGFLLDKGQYAPTVWTEKHAWAINVAERIAAHDMN